MRLWLLLLVACGGKTTDSAAPPADTGPTDWASLGCDEAPTVDWNTFGAGFITHHCQGCHASTTLDRYGAPEDVHFDDVDAVWAWRDRVLDRAAAEPPTMPPAGGTEPDQRQMLRWWLECGEEGR
jgi:uncharacterized membrane protein